MRPEFTLHDLLENAAGRFPEKSAIVDGSTSYTYAELDGKSAALAAALIESGVRRGDRVGVYMDKSPEVVVAMLAISKAGGAFVNISPLLKSQQAEHIIGDCEVRVLIGDSPKLAALEPKMVETAFYKGSEEPSGAGHSVRPLSQALESGEELRGAPRVQENDLSNIIYTSGSTGMPKGVALSHRNLVAGAQIVSTYLENTSDDRILSVLPLNFDAGLNQFTTSLRAGATLVLQHSQLPKELLQGLRENRITGLAGVPPLWTLLLRSRRSLEAEPLHDLRYITNTGGRIPQENLDELKRLLTGLGGTDIYLMYGLTEAFRSTYLPPEEIWRSSPEAGWCIGKAIPDTDVWVVTDDDREADVGETGELVHRGPTVAQGYWNREEATREVFAPSPFARDELPDHERVVYSGDLVRRDEEGYLYMLGRKDAMIKVQGYRLSPEEVENLLISSGEVYEACAFGATGPPDYSEAQVIAVASLKAGSEATSKSLREFCVKNAPPHIVPKEINLREELPKNSTGKIDRKAIENEYSSS